MCGYICQCMQCNIVALYAPGKIHHRAWYLFACNVTNLISKMLHTKLKKMKRGFFSVFHEKILLQEIKVLQ